MHELQGYVCLVTGASRGIGKGIALGLGECGATVYITGRTLKTSEAKEVGGSLEETAAAIVASGGKAIPLAIDHSDENQVIELFNQIRREQHGRLDLLVNNAYTAVPFLFANAGKSYYEINDRSPGEVWDHVNNVGLRNHYICSVLATRMMLDFQDENRYLRPGLIINVSSFGGKRYMFNTAYGMGKAAVDRMTNDMAYELKSKHKNICVLSLWPAFVRTELMVAERVIPLTSENSESPKLVGRVVAALTAESADKLLARSGQVCLVSDIADQYGIRESDGCKPANHRSLKVLLQFKGCWWAQFIPKFIRLPKFLFMYLISWV
ncbi:unnamed protein product [Calicophoron daubneyi]|uniref:Dehydrogenase/reductase SDR family member 1 n=1 Tax=Calicophoron daubneyi TaxID=300641 RepID=A0AAV2T384_CALDB